MTGLEKILKAIDDNSAERCKQIISDYEKKAEGVEKELIENANQKSARELAKTEETAKQVIERALSAAALEASKERLKLKNELIELVIKESRNKILSLSTDDYFLYLYRLASYYIQAGCCTIAFNEKDSGRIPDDFIEKLNLIKDGSLVELSSDTVDISGGFILDYGDTQENCDLDELISYRRDEIRRTAAEILFVDG